MRELEKGMKGLASQHEKSMRQMSQSTQQHGQKFSTVVNQVIHPSIVKITAALGALSTAVGGFKAFEGVVKNLQQVGDLSRDLNVTALSLNALDKSLQNIGANRGTAASLVTTLQDAVQRNRGNLVLLQGMGVTARENAERVIELSRFVKREAAANRFDIAVQRLAEIGYSVADARRLLALSEEDYRRQQGIRRRWKQDSADDIKAAQDLRREWGDLMSNMEGVQDAIFVPMMKTTARLIKEVNSLIAGHETEIRAFFTAITEPIGQWAEGKAKDMLDYMKKLTGDEGAQERAAWVKWWQDTKKETNDVVRDVLTIVHGVSEAIQLLSKLNRARRENIERVENEEIDKAESRRRDQQRDYRPGVAGERVPARHRPYTFIERFMRHLPGGEEMVRTNREIAEVREAEAAGASAAPAPVIGHGRLGGAVGATSVIQQQKLQEEEVRVTRDNTEEIKKNTQELQEQRRSRGFFGTAWDQIKNLVGMGGGEGPPDISGRGSAGGGGIAGGGGGSSGDPGAGAIGGRVDRGGFEPNPAGHVTPTKGSAAVNSWMNFLMKPVNQGGLGFTRAQAAGQVASLRGESGSGLEGVSRTWNDPSGSGKPGISGGVASWRNERFRALQAHAASKGLDWRSHEAQQSFYREEMLGKYRNVYDNLRRSQTAAQALDVHVRQFEAPARPDPAIAQRSGYLNDLMNRNLNEPPSASQVRQRIRDMQGGEGAGRIDTKGADPRISEIVAAAQKYLPPGYKVETTSGFRGGTRQSFHGHGKANDFHIVDPQGRIILNRGEDPTGLYQQLARGAYTEQLKRYPELTGKFAWGGAFGTQLGGGGVRDLMHFDLGGERGRYEQYRLSNMGPLQAMDKALNSAQPISTPSNISNDNSKSVTQHNEYKTTINAEDAKGAASIFKGAAENINRLNMSQIKGVIR
jgi:hypothetical protein